MPLPSEHDSGNEPGHDTALVIKKLLADRSVPAKEECLAADGNSLETVEQIYDEVLAFREILKSFSKGDFSVQITNRGAIWGYLKTLQANLLHLTWQVEQVAAGDLSQRVDFMGDFSAAFNKMVVQLEDSLEAMKDREATERTQIMLDATPLCCMFWNEQREVIDCNLESVKLFGLRDKQEFLERFFELLPEYQPDGQLSAKAMKDKVDEAFEKGYLHQEFLHQRADGAPIPAEITLVRVQQKGNYIIAAYIRDIRELKQKQAALENQQLLLLDVINSSPICFAILVENRIEFLSTFMTDFLGLRIGEPLFDCFVNQEKGMDLLSSVKKDVHVNWEPITVRSKDGDIKEMLATLFLTKYHDEPAIIVWLVDITEIKSIEADLRAAKETAEHLGQVKDEFIANMSHELRTPMNAVLGIIHLLHKTSLSEEQASYVSTMEASAKNLLYIINDILDFSEIESGKVFSQSEEFDMRQPLVNVLSLFQEESKEKGLLLFHSVDDNVPVKVTGDPLRLQQILVSLVDNALKFTEYGSVQIRVQLESSVDENVVLRFSVQDTGIGIKPEVQEEIFRPFSQADTSGTRRYGGIGLGLAVVASLVEMIGGRIWFESESQRGSTFFFTAAFKLPKYEFETVVFPEPFQGMPILLAEDNRVNLIVATKLLQDRGFHVDVAPNGLRAVEMVKQKTYALVLMDIQMPEMDGIQATREIRSDPQYAMLPIVAVTANAMEDDLRQYRKAGINDHVAKPINPVLLDRAILQWAKPVTASPQSK